MADIWLKRSDTAPVIAAVLRDANGNPADIADAAVRFIMREIRGTDPVISAAASNDQTDEDDTIGHVSYTLVEGDTMDEGGYYGEFEVTYDGGQVETFPNSGYITIAIVADLDEEAAS